MDKLVLIDGNAILHRAYHAYPPLTTSKGELINAVYGFTSILLTVLKQIKPKYVAVTFDKKAPTFRHIEYKAYKAHRPKMDEELVGQIDRVHEVVRTLNMPIFEIDGFEADDVIGTLAKKVVDINVIANFSLRKRKLPKVKQACYGAGKSAKTKELEVIIVTGDYDTLQLVNKNVRVMMPPRGKQPAAIFNKEAVIKKYGFTPNYIIDFKALVGDASDGIPGVTGIGPKTATDLINQFGTIENIYRELGITLDKKKATRKSQIKTSVLQKLFDGAELAKLSKRLATIVTNVPLKLNLEKCRLLDYDRKKAIELFEKLEFRTLINRLPSESWEEIIKEKPVEKEQEKKEEQMGLF